MNTTAKDLTHIKYCLSCHKVFLDERVSILSRTNEEQCPIEHCPACVQSYEDHIEYMEEGYHQARLERYEQAIKERDNWRLDQFEKRLDEQYRQRQLADEYRESRI